LWSWQVLKANFLASIGFRCCLSQLLPFSSWMRYQLEKRYQNHLSNTVRFPQFQSQTFGFKSNLCMHLIVSGQSQSPERFKFDRPMSVCNWCL
jgi:hypothetical protein